MLDVWKPVPGSFRPASTLVQSRAHNTHAVTVRDRARPCVCALGFHAQSARVDPRRAMWLQWSFVVHHLGVVYGIA
eukprot:1653228-Prymnesium_polylepis.1